MKRVPFGKVYKPERSPRIKNVLEKSKMCLVGASDAAADDTIGSFSTNHFSTRATINADAEGYGDIQDEGGVANAPQESELYPRTLGFEMVDVSEESYSQSSS